MLKKTTVAPISRSFSMGARSLRENPSVLGMDDDLSCLPGTSSRSICLDFEIPSQLEWTVKSIRGENWIPYRYWPPVHSKQPHEKPAAGICINLLLRRTQQFSFDSKKSAECPGRIERLNRGKGVDHFFFCPCERSRKLGKKKPKHRPFFSSSRLKRWKAFFPVG